MLPIKKGPAPQELINATRRIEGTPNATLSWRNITSPEREATLQALLDEQGHLCAYCTDKIKMDNAHVEHIIPQSEAAGADDPHSVDYGNLLAVCDGFAGCAGGQTCDRSRGDTPLTVNPLKPETLESIRYLRDGRILSDDSAVNQDLDRTLNLNQPLLVRNRGAVLGVLFEKLERTSARGGNRRVVSFCRSYVDEHLKNPQARNPYDGAIIYFMKKRLRASGVGEN